MENDRFARTTQVTINDKVIQTPNFCTLVQNESELESLINLNLLSETKYLGTYIVRLFDAQKVIIPRLENKKQLSLTNLQSVEELYNKFCSKNVLIIDPALEYLLYEFHANKFATAVRDVRTKTKQLDVLLQYLKNRDDKKMEIEVLKIKDVSYATEKEISILRVWLLGIT